MEKLVPKESASHVSDSTTDKNKTQPKTPLDRQHSLADTPRLTSQEFSYHPRRKDHRVVQRPSIGSTSTASSTSSTTTSSTSTSRKWFHNPDTISVSASSSLSLNLRRGLFSRQTDCPSQWNNQPKAQHGRKTSSGSLTNTVKAKNHTTTFSNRQNGRASSHCASVPILFGMESLSSPLKPNCTEKAKMDMPEKTNKDARRSTNGRCVLSEDVFFKGRESASSVTGLPQQRIDSSEAVMENIVLIIAYDHITNLRNQYCSIKNKNLWLRYRRMKAMIKSCMNVLKSC